MLTVPASADPYGSWYYVVVPKGATPSADDVKNGVSSSENDVSPAACSGSYFLTTTATIIQCNIEMGEYAVYVAVENWELDLSNLRKGSILLQTVMLMRTGIAKVFGALVIQIVTNHTRSFSPSLAMAKTADLLTGKRELAFQAKAIVQRAAEALPPAVPAQPLPPAVPTVALFPAATLPTALPAAAQPWNCPMEFP